MTTLTHNADGTVTISVTLELVGSMMEMENDILDGINEVGCLATGEALKRFDTEGQPIIRNGEKYTAKNQDAKKYQTPYGVVSIERYVYQTAKGGRIFCPLEASAHTVLTSTPKFAQQITHKYSQGHAPSVCADLSENHNRSIAKATVQNIADWVGSIAHAEEENWAYTLPDIDEPIQTVVFSLDGAYILMANEGYREAMVGNISLYDAEGVRQHTIYLGEAPEYGKATFKARYEREIIQVKARYPNALYLGIADGAQDNWTFLTPHTDRQLLDFYHVTEYLTRASHAIYPSKKTSIERRRWLSECCTQLKHEPGAAQVILNELKTTPTHRLSGSIQEDLEAAITYFTNNVEKGRMNYARHIDEALPIGSGVTEAACKTLVKQRLCGSGMRWKTKGARVVLSLRALVQTTCRWQQFWIKMNQLGDTFQMA